MNVKSVWNSLTNIAGISTQKLDKKKKLEASDEKDTQLGYGQEEAAQHRMSEEEALKAVESLKGLDGVKENNLTVRLEKINDRFVVYVDDPQGKIVRRIVESELWSILKNHQNQSEKKGQILNKAG